MRRPARLLVEPGAAVAFTLTMAVALAGCAIPAPTAAPDQGEASRDPGAATPIPTPDVTDVALDALFGNWRRAPAHPTPEMAQAAEAACREQGAVAALPLVVLDARGQGEVTLVFAGPKAAAVCHATIARDGTATADARPIAGGVSATPASGKLGGHDIEIIDSGSGARTVLVGRVGPDVARVAAQFQDATWSNASMAGGWYAMWWPGRDPALTVAAVDSRSEALDGFTP